MAEAQTVYQTAFAGLADDQVAGDIVDKCRAMLAEEPDTREDYMVAYIRYLDRYHNLDWQLQCRIAGTEGLIRFLTGDGIPSFRTVANRCQELMRADASLQPKRDVMDKRQQQRRQGRVR